MEDEYIINNRTVHKEVYNAFESLRTELEKVKESYIEDLKSVHQVISQNLPTGALRKWIENRLDELLNEGG